MSADCSVHPDKDRDLLEGVHQRSKGTQGEIISSRVDGHFVKSLVHLLLHHRLKTSAT